MPAVVKLVKHATGWGAFQKVVGWRLGETVLATGRYPHPSEGRIVAMKVCPDGQVWLKVEQPGPRRSPPPPESWLWYREADVKRIP